VTKELQLKTTYYLPSVHKSNSAKLQTSKYDTDQFILSAE